MALIDDILTIENETTEGANTAARIGAALKGMMGTMGWSEYRDTEYSSGSPFTITAGAANKVTLPNNAGIKIETHKPTYFDTFYDEVNKLIPGRSGDSFALNLELIAVPKSAVSNIKVKTAIDIGGSVGEIYPDERTLTKGQGVAHGLLFPFPVIYTLDTFEANGGALKIWSENADVDIYNVRYVFANHSRNMIPQ